MNLEQILACDMSPLDEYELLAGPVPSRDDDRRENNCRLSLRESTAAFAERKATIGYLLICRDQRDSHGAV